MNSLGALGIIGGIASIIGLGIALYERSERPKCPHCGQILVVVIVQGQQILECNNCGHKSLL